MSHYTTVRKTAERLGLSERRIQSLCHEGRMDGAICLCGVWMIPDYAKKPEDLRKKRSVNVLPNQMSVFDFVEGDTLFSLSRACEYLGISEATASNWIRSGYLEPSLYREKKPYFRLDELRILLSKIAVSDDNHLKSRRNKSQISGISTYTDYLSPDNELSARNMELIRQMVELASGEPDIEDLIPLILAEYAIRFLIGTGRIHTDRKVIPSLRLFFGDELELGEYSPLIHDFFEIGNPISRSAPEILEKLLSFPLVFVPGQDVLGLLYISLKSLRDRKATGTYYTPDRIVSEMCDRAMKLIRGNDDHILDPCCGTGNFLLSLQNRGVRPDCLFGQDNDEISIAVARINLALNCEDIYLPSILENLICLNTLMEEPHQNEYDLMIGNPPWGYSFSKEEAADLKKKYISADSKTPESFRLFLEFGLNHLKDNGYLSFVLPESILNVASHSTIRKMIATSAAVTHIAFRPDGFRNVQCPSIELTLKKHGNAEWIDVETPERSFRVSESRCTFLTEAEKGWNLSTDEETFALLKKIENFTPSICFSSPSAEYALGIVTGNNAKMLLENTPEAAEDGAEPILRGSEVFRYRTAPAKNAVVFDPEAFQQCAPEKIYRAPEKLIYRFICNRPVFAYDDSQTLTLNSANIMVPNVPQISIFYLLGVLNSSVAQFYFQNTYHSVKMLRSHIESLAVPRVPLEAQKEIENMVKELIFTCDEKERAVDLTRALDEAIYYLYHLNEKEIAMVERNTDRNKEEELLYTERIDENEN